MVGWHHRLNGHEFEQALGDGEGQGSLRCCSPWGHKESDIRKRLNNNKNTDSIPNKETESQLGQESCKSLWPVSARIRVST